MKQISGVTSSRGKPARARTRKPQTQATLPFRAWGGARPGAGRKRKADRPRVEHRPRGKHARSVPVQVTSRLVTGVRSLRNAAELAVVRAALARSQRDSFRIVHHSIQSNHLHLIVEADDRAALTSGVRGLLVRLARDLNLLWKRRGSLFSDRFHERALRTPREVRNSLLYVLQNARKHGVWMRGPDPCSSGAEFDGWDGVGEAIGALRHKAKGPRVAGSAQSSGGSVDSGPNPAGGIWRRARTWLLEIGWRRHGLLRESEVPRGAFGAIATGR